MLANRYLTKDLLYLGASDRRIGLFENVFPLENGVSYNAYLLLDEQTVLLDTVDRSVSEDFFESLATGLDGRSLDYLIVNHMEPDHCASIGELLLRYPGVRVVGNNKTHSMLMQFFPGLVPEAQRLTVQEGDTLVTGRHTLAFAMAPMVHWPEAMVTFDTTDGTLFSADAFGTFGALSGNLYADELPFSERWMDEALRHLQRFDGTSGDGAEPGVGGDDAAIP